MLDNIAYPNEETASAFETAAQAYSNRSQWPSEAHWEGALAAPSSNGLTSTRTNPSSFERPLQEAPNQKEYPEYMSIFLVKVRENVPAANRLLQKGTRSFDDAAVGFKLGHRQYSTPVRL